MHSDFGTEIFRRLSLVTGADAGAFHVEQHEADARVFFGAEVGAYQAKNPVSLVSVRGPDFLTVDDEMITLQVGSCLQ